MSKTGKIFVVSGPSGSGKTTLIKTLESRKVFSDGPVKVATVTTRRPRRGERDGCDYHFISREEFLRRRRRGEFVEHQEIFNEYYGTPKKDLLKVINQGKDALICIDVRGALCIRRAFPKNSVLIFIATPDMQSLKRRLLSRSTEGRGSLTVRLAVAREEMGFVKYYDYVVVNDVLTEALRELSAIISAERLRITRG